MVKSVEGSVGGASLTATGWIEPDPYPHYVSALVEGTVAEVFVLEGQPVRAGDVVARLVDADARIALAAAEAELAVAAAELESHRASLAAGRERLETKIDLRRAARVTEAAVGEVVAELAILEAEIAAGEAALRSLEDEIVRKEPLLPSGAVAAGEFRRLTLAAVEKGAEIEADRARRGHLQARRESALAERDAAAESLARAIDERLALADAEAEVARDEGAVAAATARRDEARLAFERTEVRAPVDGVVLARLVAPGSRVMLGGETHSAHVVHLYDPAHLQVRVDIPLADAAAVGVDQGAEVVISALPDRRFRGRVTRLVHEANLQKNTVEVKVAIEDPLPLLKPEMLARVHFLAAAAAGSAAGRSETRERILVPERLLPSDGGSAATLWVVERREGDRGTAAERAVELGETRVDGFREVHSGLSPGDLVIVSPPAGLSPGDAVTIESEDDR
jgi:RND family efflux transporter MFP subunit